MDPTAARRTRRTSLTASATRDAPPPGRDAARRRSSDAPPHRVDAAAALGQLLSSSCMVEPVAGATHPRAVAAAQARRRGSAAGAAAARERARVRARRRRARWPSGGLTAHAGPLGASPEACARAVRDAGVAAPAGAEAWRDGRCREGCVPRVRPACLPARVTPLRCCGLWSFLWFGAGAGEVTVALGQRNVPVEQQGDLHWYTPQSLKERARLRCDVSVVACVRRHWERLMPPAGGGAPRRVTRGMYASLFRSIRRLLLPEQGAVARERAIAVSASACRRRHRLDGRLFVSPPPPRAYQYAFPHRRRRAQEDWAADARGGDELVFSEFFDALFELTDTWCGGVGAGEYAHFLDRLYAVAEEDEAEGEEGPWPHVNGGVRAAAASGARLGGASDAAAPPGHIVDEAPPPPRRRRPPPPPEPASPLPPLAHLSGRAAEVYVLRTPGVISPFFHEGSFREQARLVLTEVMGEGKSVSAAAASAGGGAAPADGLGDVGDGLAGGAEAAEREEGGLEELAAFGLPKARAPPHTRRALERRARPLSAPPRPRSDAAVDGAPSRGGGNGGMHNRMGGGGGGRAAVTAARPLSAGARVEGARGGARRWRLAESSSGSEPDDGAADWPGWGAAALGGAAGGALRTPSPSPSPSPRPDARPGSAPLARRPRAGAHDGGQTPAALAAARRRLARPASARPRLPGSPPEHVYVTARARAPVLSLPERPLSADVAAGTVLEAPRGRAGRPAAMPWPGRGAGAGRALSPLARPAPLSLAVMSPVVPAGVRLDAASAPGPRALDVGGDLSFRPLRAALGGVSGARTPLLPGDAKAAAAAPRRRARPTVWYPVRADPRGARGALRQAAAVPARAGLAPPRRACKGSASTGAVLPPRVPPRPASAQLQRAVPQMLVHGHSAAALSCSEAAIPAVAGRCAGAAARQ